MQASSPFSKKKEYYWVGMLPLDLHECEDDQLVISQSELWGESFTVLSKGGERKKKVMVFITVNRWPLCCWNSSCGISWAGIFQFVWQPETKENWRLERRWFLGSIAEKTWHHFFGKHFRDSGKNWRCLRVCCIVFGDEKEAGNRPQRPNVKSAQLFPTKKCLTQTLA